MGGGRSVASLYHPHIRIKASFTRGCLDARRVSTTVPDVSSIFQNSPFIIACNCYPISQRKRWSWRGSHHATTLVLTRHKVSAVIQSFRSHSLRRGIRERPPQIRKLLVPLVLSQRRVKGEPPAPPKVVRVFPQGGSMEAPQDHVVVWVLLGVPDRDVLEQTAVFTQKVVWSEAHLPRPSIIYPGFSAWEEMCQHDYSPAVASASMITSLQGFPYGTARFALNFPSTINAAPQRHWTMAKTVIYMVEASSRAK